MAKHGKGILGDFSGKVGTVVGSSWNGIAYMRSKPAFKKNRKLTEAQELQQAKFALGAGFIKSMNPLISLSYQRLPGKTTRNQALSKLLAEAISGSLPNLSINYSQVMVARGSLKKADNPQVSSPLSGLLRFNWTDNTGLGNATAQDKAILVAYSPDTDDVIFTVEGGNRSQGTGNLDVSYFSGKNVHTWISFRSVTGELSADSIYTGMVTVL